VSTTQYQHSMESTINFSIKTTEKQHYVNSVALAIGSGSYWARQDHPPTFLATVAAHMPDLPTFGLTVLTSHVLLSYRTYFNISLCCRTNVCSSFSKENKYLTRIQYHCIIFIWWFKLLLASICMGRNSLRKFGLLSTNL